MGSGVNNASTFLQAGAGGGKFFWGVITVIWRRGEAETVAFTMREARPAGPKRIFNSSNDTELQDPVET